MRLDSSQILDCSALRGFIAFQRGHSGPSCCDHCHGPGALEHGRLFDGHAYALCCRMVRWLDAYKPGWRDDAGQL